MINHIIIKVSQICNLRCSYCSANIDERNPLVKEFDKEKIIENLTHLFQRVNEYLRGKDNKEFGFSWFGGEPLLFPIGFYDRLTALQKEIISPEITVTNRISTNGLLLTERRIDELERNDIKICISLDGHKKIHDAHRQTVNSKGTYDKVIEIIGRLRKRNIPFGILTVIDSEGNGREIYKHHKKLSIKGMDFLLPFKNYTDTALGELNSVTENKIIKYLVGAFDEWFSESPQERIAVSWFDSIFSKMLGGTGNLCFINKLCPGIISFYNDGRFGLCNMDYCQDFSENMIPVTDFGAITKVEELASYIMLRDESKIFSEECIKCEYFDICGAGCPVYRYNKTNGQVRLNNKSIYCNVLKRFYSHIKKEIMNRYLTIN